MDNPETQKRVDENTTWRNKYTREKEGERPKTSSAAPTTISNPGMKHLPQPWAITSRDWSFCPSKSLDHLKRFRTTARGMLTADKHDWKKKINAIKRDSWMLPFAHFRLLYWKASLSNSLFWTFAVVKHNRWNTSHHETADLNTSSFGICYNEAYKQHQKERMDQTCLSLIN